MVLNRFPLWKNLLVIAVIVIGLIFALPNIYGDAPAVQVSAETGQPLDETALQRVTGILDLRGISHTPAYLEEGRVTVRFPTVEDQLRSLDLLREQLGDTFVVALTLAPRTPAFLRDLGLQPMSLGLDLRGGVHFMYEVDMDAAIAQALDRFETDFRAMLREAGIRYKSVQRDDAIVRVVLASEADREAAADIIFETNPELDVTRREAGGDYELVYRMTEELIQQRQDFAIEQNTVTLRNRVNELGVAEPVVQRQGADRIVVQLPGIQDPAQAERVLGATATLEFRLVDEANNAFEAAERGRAPIGSSLYRDRHGQPVLLQRDVIATGDQLTDASAGFNEGQPAVFVNLDARGARRMGETTRANLQKRMAVVFIEQKRDLVEREGETREVTRTEERVISVATIQGVFSNRFMITGLDPLEARDLALLLRAGSLAAPIYKVEERTIGPSLGQQNIERGLQAVVIGFLAVVVFMALYYRVFGLIANLALLANLVLVVALLSMLQASLTLPGIAGIVLTVGMAVDANVLIFERIREELRNGNSPQAAIHAGYEKAFSSIADANITTLIAAVVLFTFGTGPIRGFAVTLSLGIITSMFTAIVGTRAVVNALYGGRRIKSLPI
ncbi:protein translocase subunit SecD [Thioalkalivibrio sp. XN279]|uniref:protein translocase subunit SecD n=1 Tax=Thioalkalivibrio sp. XN279 TaxID=2714953 RepID=UPI00140BD23E|nr:protein translocase subunit SecD [Thioalkalivibrio sp. XN279]